SRRRHTRFSRDWSSDVCSSDLGLLQKQRQAVMDVLAPHPEALLATAPAIGALGPAGTAKDGLEEIAEVVGVGPGEAATAEACSQIGRASCRYGGLRERRAVRAS